MLAFHLPTLWLHDPENTPRHNEHVCWFEFVKLWCHLIKCCIHFTCIIVIINYYKLHCGTIASALVYCHKRFALMQTPFRSLSTFGLCKSSSSLRKFLIWWFIVYSTAILPRILLHFYREKIFQFWYTSFRETYDVNVSWAA